MVLVSGLTILAFVVARFTASFGVGAVALGVALGLVAGNLRPPGALWRTGVDFAGKRLLAFAVVLLGLRVMFDEFARFGVPLSAAVLVVVGALVVALLMGKWFAVDARFAALIGVGTGVCGVAAIAALRGVVGARQAETTYAVAAITLLGSIGLVVFPLVQILWHPLHPEAFGVLTGATLHSVPQAVGAGFAGAGEAGGTLATVVKLTRVALLGPLVLVVAMAWRAVAAGEEGHEARRRLPRLPVEVWGFLLVVLLGNLLPVPEAIRSHALAASEVLLVMALTALGLSTRFLDLRAVGLRPLAIAVLVWAAIVAIVFMVVKATGFVG